MDHEKRIIRNNKGMEGYLTYLLLGVVVVAGIAVGLSVFSTDLIKSYTDYDVSALNSSYVKYSNNLSDKAVEMKDALEWKPTGIGIVDLGIAVINGAYRAVNMLIGSVEVVWGLFSDMFAITGVGETLPSWFTGMVSTALFLGIILAIIAWYMRRTG